MWSEQRPDGSTILHLDPMRGMPFYSDWLQILLDRGAAVEMSCATGSLCGKCYIAGGHVPGCDRKSIKPLSRLDQRVVLQEGKAAVLCICCGIPVTDALLSDYRHVTQAKFRSQGRLKSVGRPNTKVYNDNIRIGGRVQVRGDEEDQGDKLFYVKWKLQPVYFEGIGCTDCKQLFRDAERSVAQTNKDRERYATLVARLEGVKVEAQKGERPISPCVHFSIVALQASCSICAKLRGDRVTVQERKLPGQITPYIDVFATTDSPTAQKP